MYLYGAGGHAKVIIDVLSSLNVKIYGLLEDTGTKNSLQSIPVFPGVKLSGNPLPQLNAPLIICIGNNSDRAEFADLLDVSYGTATAPSAIVSPSAIIGHGTVILQGAIIQADSIIGNHVIINADSSIDHENIIEDFVHISPKATLCGNVHVGKGTYIGAGATVIPGIKIGKWCIVEAGTVVIRDIPDFTIAVGNPARFLSEKSMTFYK